MSRPETSILHPERSYDYGSTTYADSPAAVALGLATAGGLTISERPINLYDIDLTP
jgi:hypothetical protein